MSAIRGASLAYSMRDRADGLAGEAYDQRVGISASNEAKAVETLGSLPGGALGVTLGKKGGRALSKKLGDEGNVIITGISGVAGATLGSLAGKHIMRATGLPADVARGKVKRMTEGTVKMPYKRSRRLYKDYGAEGLGYAAYKESEKTASYSPAYDYLEKRASQESARRKGLQAQDKMNESIGRFHPKDAAKWGAAMGGLMGVPMGIHALSGDKGDRDVAIASTVIGAGLGAVAGNQLARERNFNKRISSRFRTDAKQKLPKEDRELIKTLGKGAYGSAVEYSYRDR